VRYALIIYADPEVRSRIGPETEDAREDWVSYIRSAQQAGVFLTAVGLHDPDTATTVRRPAGELLLTDGPFAETKEHLLGLLLIEAADLDTAIDWAARMPVALHGSVEIRPLLPALEAVGRAGSPATR
jgi:hypothetical protein